MYVLRAPGVPTLLTDAAARDPPEFRPDRDVTTPDDARWSDLFDFDERAAEVFRVQEQDRFAVRAVARFAITEYPGSVRHKFVARLNDVVNFKTQMMNATGLMAVEKPRYR